ncbi:putative ATPase [Microbacterium endophyticum]|uniref:Putative ATPase n=1 Tax=Microbacterium endophyticum TaxID=1526412 RepID=A0A7W4YP77_9MICO|nr:AAA family ATPase [Microbacterium endophyticum]MBB2976481.1 putative ATPase [Microbacterium endophyticum]NIK35927.1 putative ATPase [Microbacterium endophyticum]
MRSIDKAEFETLYSARHSHLLGGDPAGFSFSLEEIRVQGGDVIRPQRAGVTAIVGANNAGKSTLLREAHTYIGVHPGQIQPPRILVEAVSIAGSDSPADLVAWMLENSTPVVDGPNTYFARARASQENAESFEYYWNIRTVERGGTGGIGGLCAFLTFYGDASGRLSLGASAELRDSVLMPPTHPVHYLEDSVDLRQRLSDISQRVFGRTLTLDTLARTVRLRVGSLPGEAPRYNDVSREYREAMGALPALDEQGDGMRSFFGQLLPVVTATYPLILLDEPEAFLHPPQAHALGVELGKIATERGTQIIVATHDRHLLTGLLDSGGDVSVVRVSRSDTSSAVRQLDAAQLRSIWTDPVLKYSNVLDGLFHQVVVLAEAEGDCAYLAAAAGVLNESAGASPSGEALFVASAGKQGMWKLAEALRAVDVPVVAAPDMDIISDEGETKRLFNALGGQWDDDLSSLWSTATAAQRAPREPVKIAHVLDAVAGTLTPRRDEIYTPVVRDEVLSQIRSRESPWAEVKKHGIAAFNGQARAALLQLLERMETVGLVLVRAGELERLAPDVIARKGPAWLEEAFRSEQHRNATTQEHIVRVTEVGRRLAGSRVANGERVDA